MCFKTPVCKVLCLVITAILHSVTAELDALSIEALMDQMFEKFEQKLMEKFQAQNREGFEKQAASFENLECFINNVIAGQLELQKQTSRMMTNLQTQNTIVKQENSRYHKKLIEKLDVHATNVQQMTESINHLRNDTNGLLAGQLKNQNQLSSLTIDVHRLKTHTDQEKAKLNEIHTLLRDTRLQNDQVIGEEIAESIKNLENINKKLLAGHSENQKQLTSVRNEISLIITDDFPSSCTTLKNNATGTYYIRPAETVKPFLVRCDFEENFELGGGWTVFQHRYDGSVDFYRNWTMYKNGFGDVNAEHWLGLEKLHAMTKSGKHELLIILVDFDGETAYAHYKDFKIGSEVEKYELSIGNYSGTAGDSLKIHNGIKFSTFDQDNNVLEIINCAEKYRGGWWFYGCFYGHLNGEYQKKGEHVTVDFRGVKWDHWKGYKYSLKSTKMMLRRRSA